MNPDGDEAAARRRFLRSITFLFVGLCVAGFLFKVVTARRSSPASPLSAADSVAEPDPEDEGVATVADSVGDWVVDSETSPLDDGPTLYASVVAASDVADWLGTKYRPKLYVRRKGHRFTVYVHTGMPAAIEQHGDIEDGSYSLDEAAVRYRVDKRPTRRVLMNKSTSDKALFFRSSGQVVDDLARGETFYFEFTPFHGSPEDVEFNVHGFGRLLIELQKRHGYWSATR